MALSDDQNLECPLCMEPFEMDDFNFFPCTCGYQICRFCWHRIRTDENGLCPACRKQYPEDPADFKPLSAEELQKIKSEKRQKDQQRKQKMSECRKHLANVRVVQKNLVFVVGLPARLADADVLKKHDYFGKFGKIHKVVVNQSTSYAGSQGPSASAYVTYCRPEDALRAIKSVNNIQVDGRTLKASLGTTKYCSHFLKNQQCPKADCMYLHELGDEAASFTKEDMQQGKHQEYERKLQDQILGCNNRKLNISPIPQQNSGTKDTWPCTVDSMKEQRPNKSRDSIQGQKTEKNNRSKGKHNVGDSQRRYARMESSFELQRGKKSKNRVSDSSHNSANVNKTSNKDDSSLSKKNQKQSRHSKGSQSLNQIPLQRVEDVSVGHVNSKATDALEKNVKNAQTTYVEITEKPSPNHSSANIKIARSASPSLPPSPASSSSSSLFTPFGSLSSNFLSSSPSPPPSNASQPFQLMGNTSNVQDAPLANTYAMPTCIEHNRRVSPPCRVLRNMENNDSLFSHIGNMPVSNDLGFYNGHIPAEDEIAANEDSDWNSRYPFGSSPKLLEDDLDFDPWDESSKGLADLMAKEANTNPSYNNSSMPPGFSSYKTSVPNSQRIAVPPPGFGARQQMPIPETSAHMHNSYMANPVFSSKLYMNEKRQNLMEAVPHVYHQPSHSVHSNQSNQFPNHNSCDMNSQMLKEYIRMRRQATFQENFRALFPNINVSFGSQNLQKNHNQNGPSWNSRDMSWLYNDANMFNSGNMTEGQRNVAAPYLMKALQQLKMDDSLNPYNGHSPYSAPFALRGQWPTSSPCPPPGFVAPSSSTASNLFQHMQVNQKI